MTQSYYLNTPSGAIYSADHNLERFKPENLVKSRSETLVPNLTQVYIKLALVVTYLCIQGGQDIFCCGVATTITTGMVAASHVLGRNLLIEAETIKNTL